MLGQGQWTWFTGWGHCAKNSQFGSSSGTHWTINSEPDTMDQDCWVRGQLYQRGWVMGADLPWPVSSLRQHVWMKKKGKLFTVWKSLNCKANTSVSSCSHMHLQADKHSSISHAGAQREPRIAYKLSARESSAAASVYDGVWGGRTRSWGRGRPWSPAGEFLQRCWGYQARCGGEAPVPGLKEYTEGRVFKECLGFGVELHCSSQKISFTSRQNLSQTIQRNIKKTMQLYRARERKLVYSIDKKNWGSNLAAGEICI